MDHIASIRTFTRVVELGSFSKAADDLMLSQSTVTKHIVSLETPLRARLLNRNTRGVSLTEAGALYYERCKVILIEVNDADALVGRSSEGLVGALRLSTSVAFGRRIVAPMLIEFMREHPHLKIDITCEDAFVDLVSRGLSTLLSAVHLHLGIGILPRYVASLSLKSGEIVRVLGEYVLPHQELHAVFPSPKLVPQKVTSFINYLIPRFQDAWWDA